MAGAARAQTPALSWLTPGPAFETFAVPDTGRLCRAGAPIALDVARPTTLTLTLDGATAVASLDGAPPAPVAAVVLSAGRHSLYVQPPAAAVDALVPSTLVFSWTDPGGAGHIEQRLGDDLVNRPVLAVGRTFLSGVDLLDGQLVRQRTDLKLKGRHLALELTRTYASSGPFAASPMGAGWSHSYDVRLVPLPACGLVVVRTADGGRVGFTGDAARGYTPQRGYHSRLRQLADGSWEFQDKAAVRWQFRDPAWPGGPARRLARIEEPHGDQVVLQYDAAGRLDRVHEWHPGTGPVRTLLFEWTQAAGWPRIGSVRAWGLGLRVDFRYDRFGNLALATRRDAELPGQSSSDRYEYSTDVAEAPHRLTAVLEDGDERVDVAWGGERVRLLTRHSTPPAITAFTCQEPRDGRLRVDAREGASLTRYLLNADGNPLEIDEPAKAGRLVTRMRYDAKHVVKLRQENDRGELWEFAYDTRGNLASESYRPRSGAASVTRYEYDPTYNKLVRKTAPDGRIDRYEILPATGDLAARVEADGKASAFTYDSHGCLTSETTAQRRVQYAGHDSYCQPTRVRGPDGSTQRRRYDARGRERKPAPVARGAEEAPAGGSDDPQRD